MRLTSTLVLGAAAVLAKELPKDEIKALRYDSGEVMEQMMMKKFAHWDSELAVGAMNSTQWPRLDYTKCVNGVAEAIKGDPHHTFRCKNIDLYDFINHATLGSPLSDASGRTGSSAWGWVDPKSGREFAVSGMYQGTAFIEILKTGKMVELAFLPPKSELNRYALWKEIRSYKNYMLIGSELPGAGIQIFDMTKLLTLDASKGAVLLGQKDLTSHIDDLPVGRSHTITVNEEKNYVVANGAAPRNDTCGAGLIFFDLTDITKPTRMGCDGSDGYVHDSQCLVYRGPDVKYQGRDICYGYNEDTLTIYDVTDKKATKVISRTSYEGATYTHQGWVNDLNWQEYIFLDDEIDEEEFAGPAADQYPVTYIFDIRNLEAPKQTGLYKAANIGIDHNQYIRDGLNYQANYGSGLRVYDVSSVKADPTGNSVCEVAFFDIFPEDDNLPGNGEAVYSGTWATYQFPSGFNFINTIERGAFLVKMTKREACKPKTCNADNCLRAMRANTVPGRLEESKAFCGEFTKSFIANVTLVKDYAVDACKGNVISRVSSACSCVLPTATAA